MSQILRPRFRSLTTVVLLVVTPWILVAVPGTRCGGGETSGTSYQYFMHGWPFVHLDRTTVERTPLPQDENGKAEGLPRDPLLAEEPNSKPTETAASFHPVKVGQLQLALRFKRQNLVFDSDGNGGQLDAFWSSRDRWPIPTEHTHMAIRRQGLAANLAVLLAAIMLGLVIAERRIDSRGRLIVVSPLGTLVLLILVLGVSAWALVASKQQRQVQTKLARILELGATDEVDLQLVQTSQFPVIISQLFNHGHTPFGSLACFKRVESGRIRLSLRNSDERHPRGPRFADTLAESPLPMDVEILHYDLEAERVLNTLAKNRIESLCIHFSHRAWLRDRLGSPEPGPLQNDDQDQQPGPQLAGVAPLNLPARLPKLKVLRLYLDDQLDQVDQLRSFSGLAIRHLRIDRLNAGGAAYLIENRHYWPLRMSVSFSGDVAPQLREKFRATFSVHHVWPDEIPFGPIS